MAEQSRLDKVIALARHRGFVFQAGEIYGGSRSAWDYGPLGTELKENIRRQWWQTFVRGRGVAQKPLHRVVDASASRLVSRPEGSGSATLRTLANRIEGAARPTSKRTIAAVVVAFGKGRTAASTICTERPPSSPSTTSVW